MLGTAAAAGLIPTGAAAAEAPRKRLSLDDGWRFTTGDPEGLNGALDYDIRPEILRSEDGKDADAKPLEAARVEATRPVLRPWILPSANPFITDPARQHLRPEGHPGADVAYVKRGFDDSRWQSVSLPHDWAIAGPFLETGPYGGMGRLKTWGPAWYRRTLDIPATDKGRRVFLDIDGAMSYASVWCNERLVGGWPYGYNSFRLDLTPHLDFGGRNTLVIRLDNPQESARWYPGAGLYRHVWLLTANAVHVGHWGTQITTPQVSAAEATVDIATTIDNEAETDAEISLVTRVYALDAQGRRGTVPAAETVRQNLRVPAGSSAVAKAVARVPKPRLWGPAPHQTPHLYVAVTQLTQGGRGIDTYETRFGIRSLRLDANKGIWINEQFVPIQGVNLHHDLGALGAAFNLRAAERQLEKLQEMGCNAIRMAHNPPAPEFLELTDRMGLMVVNEIFDSWERKKTPLDFHLIFPDWSEADTRAFVRRDRNHPSVIMWSFGNEVGEQYTAEEGAAIARRLNGIVKAEDLSRPTTLSLNFARPDMAFSAVADVIGLNYQGEGIRQEPEFEGTDRIRTAPQYDRFHETFPDKVIYGSEVASSFSSRGVYLFPVTDKITSPVRDGQGGDSRTAHVSSYELYAVDFGSSPDKVFLMQDRHPFVAGGFVWTGWDHLGEPTPYYSSRSSYCGIIDLAGFKKDRFWLYQSRWRPDLPVAHLLPHWNWAGREGEVTPVHLFTSGDEAELFVNGVSQGRIAKRPLEYRLRWDHVTYEPGEITAIAWKDGKEWARAHRRTVGEPVAVVLEADRAVFTADGKDLSFVTARIVDARGDTVPQAKAEIRFSLEGPGEIVATDNGDPTDFTAFPSKNRKAFNGLALVIVRGQPAQKGRLRLQARVEGLRPGEIVLATA